VAILDLRMPGIDGMELTRLLRERGTSPTMPILIVTASGGAAEWRRLSSLGADRFLVKPVIMDDLVALVRRAIDERAESGLKVVA
jgi:DNA-binding response OmpR family regulator